MARATFAIIAAFAFLAVCVVAWHRDAEARSPRVDDVADPRPARRAEATSRPATAFPARPTTATATTRVVAPHRGVRGVVTSPRVRLSDGTFGVDPTSWEATVYALVPSEERRTIDHIGIIKARVPRSARGEFAIDLPTGPHLVLVEHRAPGATGTPVHEAWYAYVDVTAAMRVPIDLGTHSFAADAVSGRALLEGGAPASGASVSCSDETRDPDRAALRGVHLRADADREGRFAFSITSSDRASRAVRLTVTAAGMRAALDDVAPGATVDLVLKEDTPSADVTIEVPWSSGLAFSIHALDRNLSFERASSRAPALGVIEETRRLPRGRYAVEAFRDAGGGMREWARVEIVVREGPPMRVRFEPAWSPARAVRGRAPPHAVVAWCGRASDGSTWVREEAHADDAGRFSFRGLPTSELLLVCEGRTRILAAGAAPEVDVGDV